MAALANARAGRRNRRAYPGETDRNVADGRHVAPSEESKLGDFLAFIVQHRQHVVY
jgi:hypothetical protein